MGAAHYVGRVGGLAVALGVGTAIFTAGQGVAAADSNTSGAQKNSGTQQDSGSASRSAPGKIKINGLTGRHRENADTPSSTTVATISQRLSDARDKAVAASKRDLPSPDLDQSDAKSADLTNRADGLSLLESSRDTARKAKAIATALSESAAARNAAVAQDAEVAAAKVQTVAKEWLTSPRVAARRVVNPETVQSAVGLEPIAPPQVRLSSFLTNVLGVRPFAGGPLPTPAPVISLAEALLYAGTRRELSIAAITTVAVPDVYVDEGVITGCVVTGCSDTSGGLPLTYTVIGDPSEGGKLSLDPTTGAFTFLPFAPETTTNGPTGHESFTVLVAETTQFNTLVTGIPVLGSAVFAPVIVILQQAPVIKVVLAPLIGSATVQVVDADIDSLRAGNPIAFTTMVTSWDGTQISTNFFPAIGDPDEDGQAGSETIFYGPGLAQAGATDPTNPFVETFRGAGYNVVTWDPRGEFASGGTLQLDSPQYEGADVSKLINWAATQDGVELDGPNDPNMGMVGVSYGGGIQLVVAAGDNRVDAIAPGWAWNTLPDSLYPDDAFKTAYSSLLLLGLVTTGAKINPQIYAGIITGAVLGVLTQGQIHLLQTSGPGPTVQGISAPTLLIQGTVDVLFPLQQSLVNAEYLEGNPNVKMIWFCGGHGTCLPSQGNAEADDVWAMNESLEWMDRYVKDDGSTDTDVFEWTDQNGNRWTSTVRPTNPLFTDGSITTPTWTTGKILPIIPILGGSGPSPAVPLPYSLGDGSVANNAVTIALANPESETNVVGAPEVTVTYSGIGTSRHVYGQIVDTRGTTDASDDVVVGNLVTQMPVTLNGREHTQTYYLNDIAYTVDENSSLELQIVTTATPFLNLTQFGYINIKSVSVDLPTTSQGTNQGPNLVPPTADVLVAV